MKKKNIISITDMHILKFRRFNEAKKFLNQVEDSPEYSAKAKYYLRIYSL